MFPAAAGRSAPAAGRMEKVRFFRENDEAELICPVCGRDLLQDDLKNAVAQSAYDEGSMVWYQASCKGECAKRIALTAPKGLNVVRNDISLYTNPRKRLMVEITLLNDLKKGYKFDAEAVSREQEVLSATAAYSFREPTEEEQTDFAFIDAACRQYVINTVKKYISEAERRDE